MWLASYVSALLQGLDNPPKQEQFYKRATHRTPPLQQSEGKKKKTQRGRRVDSSIHPEGWRVEGECGLCLRKIPDPASQSNGWVPQPEGASQKPPFKNDLNFVSTKNNVESKSGAESTAPQGKKVSVKRKIRCGGWWFPML